MGSQVLVHDQLALRQKGIVEESRSAQWEPGSRAKRGTSDKDKRRERIFWEGFLEDFMKQRSLDLVLEGLSPSLKIYLTSCMKMTYSIHQALPANSPVHLSTDALVTP